MKDQLLAVEHSGVECGITMSSPELRGVGQVGHRSLRQLLL